MDSQNDRIDLPDNLADAERFQRLFVLPVVEAVRVEVRSSIQPLVSAQADQEARLKELEGSQRKALIGYAVFASGLSIVLAAGWDWIKSMFRKGSA